MKKLIRRLTAATAMTGLLMVGWRIVPTLSAVDALVISAALLHVVVYCAEGLITGEWPA
jgi:hypothetical protein